MGDFCSNQIYQLANTIWQDIGTPTNISLGYVSGWIVNSGAGLGQLNNTLGTCVYQSGDAPCLVGFEPEMAPIVNTLYQITYYNQQRLATLRGNGDPNALWTTLKEGDSTITRSDVTKVAASYRDLYTDSNKRLNELVHYWTLNHSVPQGIDAAQLYAWPSP